MKYLLIQFFFLTLLSCKIQDNNINGQDRYLYSEEFIETYYGALSAEDIENSSKNEDYFDMKIYSSFDDSISLYVDDEEIFHGRLPVLITGGHEYALFTFERKKNSANIVKYYSHKYNTKVEFSLDIRFPCAVVSYGLYSKLPSENWAGPYPITCSVSYKNGCFDP